MAKYRVTSPTGDTYDVTGPEGATDEQVLQQVKAYKPAGAPQPPAAPPAPAPTAAPKAAAPAQPPPVSGGDSTSGFISGNINKGIAGLAGMPVDTIRNALNLGIAGAGSMTRTTPPLMEPGLGSSQWFENLLRRGNMIGPSAEPQSMGGRYGAAALQMMPGAAIGRPTLGQLPRAAGIAATSGLGGELASEFGEEYRGVGAMAPPGLLMGPARRLAAPPSTGERATAGRQAERFGTAKEMGIPVPPRAMQPNKPLQKMEDTTNKEFGFPAGTELSPKTLRNYSAQMYAEGYEPLATAPELAKGVIPTPAFQAQLQKLGQELSLGAQNLPQTFKSTKDAMKLLGEYGYVSPQAGMKEGMAVPPRAQPLPAKVVLRAIKKNRDDAATNFAGDKPEQKTLATIQKGIANALEQLLDENLARSGNQELLQKYRHSRTMIAKANDVIQEIEPATGKISPSRAAALQADRPLSGGIKDISDVAREFPAAVQGPKSGDEYFTKRVTPMAILHPEAMAMHWGTKWYDPLTLSRPYQSAMVDPRNKLSPEQERVMRYIFAAMAANRGNQDQGEIPAPPR